LIVAGFGFRSSASIDSLRDVFEKVIAELNFAKLKAFSVPKGKECIVRRLAAIYNVSLISVDIEKQHNVVTVTQSYYSFREKGVGSVAEYVALAAIGSDAELLLKRKVSADRLATCAVAYRRC